MTSTKHGPHCLVTRPARLTVVTKQGEAAIDALPGETAVVELVKTSLYCREG